MLTISMSTMFLSTLGEHGRQGWETWSQWERLCDSYFFFWIFFFSLKGMGEVARGISQMWQTDGSVKIKFWSNSQYNRRFNRQITNTSAQYFLWREFSSRQIKKKSDVYRWNFCQRKCKASGRYIYPTHAAPSLNSLSRTNRDHVHQKWYLSKILETTKQRKCIQVTLLQYAARNMCES